MEQNKHPLKIGILAPRTYFCGGHDVLSEYRKDIRQQIENAIKPYIDIDRPILGITGLSIGPEQDFALVCKKLNIDYIVYLPFEEQETLWYKLHKNILNQYQILLDGAFQAFTLSSQKYSPKKILQKKQRILKESDIVIYINYKIDTSKQMFIDKAAALNKKIIDIYV